MHGSKRRQFLKRSGAAALMSLVPEAVRVGAWAAIHWASWSTR